VLPHVHEIEGIEHIGDADQKLVQRIFKGERPPEGGPSSGGTTTTTTSPKKSSTPKKKKVKAETKINVKLTSEDATSPINIPTDGTAVELGRAEANGNKQCSRKQVKVTAEQATKKIYVTKLGSNPCFLYKKGQEPIALDTNVPYSVESGDVFSLLLEEYKYQVNIEEEEIPVPKKEPKPKKEKKTTEPKPPKPPKEPKAKSESTEPKKSKKKKSDDPEEQEDSGPDQYDLHDGFIDNNMEEESDPDFDPAPIYPAELEDEDVSETIKEGKSFVRHEESLHKRRYGDDEEDEEEDLVEGKRKCKYGAGCYQSNATHLATFRHPPRTGKNSDAPQTPEKKKLKTEHSNSQPKAIESDTATQIQDNEIDLMPKSNATKSKSKDTFVDMTSATQEMDDDNSKTSSSVEQLQSLFKTVKRDMIVKILKSNDNDADKAFDELSAYQASQD